MADSSSALTPAAIEAAARDAGTLLVAKGGRWATEAELLSDLAQLGRPAPLAKLALGYLVDAGLVESIFRWFVPWVESPWPEENQEPSEDAPPCPESESEPSPVPAENGVEVRVFSEDELRRLDEEPETPPDTLGEVVGVFPVRTESRLSQTPDPPLADGYWCYKATDALREWCLAPPPAAGGGENTGGADGSPPPKRPKKRGRKPDTDPKADKQIAEAWATGKYRTYAELGAAFRMTARPAKLAVDRHRHRHR